MLSKSGWFILTGLLLGGVLGVLVRHYRLCLVAAVSNVKLIRDHRYLLAFAAAALTAIIGTQLLEIDAIVNIASTSYRNSTFDWVSVIYGSFLFGIGAVLAGGDAARLLVRAGEGNKAAILASVVFLLAAYVAQYGWLEKPRLWITTKTSFAIAGGDAGLAAILNTSIWIPLIAIAVLLLIYIGWQWRRHGDTKLVAAGLLMGVLVVPAWYVTGVVTFDEFNPDLRPASFTVSGALARIGSMFLFEGVPQASIPIFFVVGLVGSSLLYSVFRRRWDTAPLPGDRIVSIVIGAFLMGVGGIVAYGCNIGQGLSGLSTLSIESLLAVAVMLVSIWLATLVLEKRSD